MVELSTPESMHPRSRVLVLLQISSTFYLDCVCFIDICRVYSREKLLPPLYYMLFIVIMETSNVQKQTNPTFSFSIQMFQISRDNFTPFRGKPIQQIEYSAEMCPFLSIVFFFLFLIFLLFSFFSLFFFHLEPRSYHNSLRHRHHPHTTPRRPLTNATPRHLLLPSLMRPKTSRPQICGHKRLQTPVILSLQTINHIC